MSKLLYFHVDAFCSQLFAGNTAGVCLLEEWLPDVRMQAIATECRLSITAFIIRTEAEFGLRVFTPRLEVDFCGHANLAAAHVLWNHLNVKEDPITFATRLGKVPLRRRENFIEYDLPIQPLSPTEPPADLLAGLGAGVSPVQVLKARDYFVVLESEEAVRNLKPDLQIFRRLETLGVIVTAPGEKVDFVSRYFAPRAGVPEDPVTDTAHSELVPYWADRLGKRRLFASQLSPRGAELFCEMQDSSIKLAGHCLTFVEGVIHFPA